MQIVAGTIPAGASPRLVALAEALGAFFTSFIVSSSNFPVVIGM
jgi:hypothetical protein